MTIMLRVTCCQKSSENNELCIKILQFSFLIFSFRNSILKLEGCDKILITGLEENYRSYV